MSAICEPVQGHPLGRPYDKNGLTYNDEHGTGVGCGGHVPWLIKEPLEDYEKQYKVQPLSWFSGLNRTCTMTVFGCRG